METNELQIVKPEEKHPCQTARHVDEVGRQVDHLETRVDTLGCDLHAELNRLTWKIGVVSALTSMLMCSVFGINILGVIM